jgi:hypothetical protein
MSTTKPCNSRPVLRPTAAITISIQPCSSKMSFGRLHGSRSLRMETVTGVLRRYRATAICLPAAPNLRRPFLKTRSAPDKETQLTSESARLLRVRETGISQCSAIAEHNSLKTPGSAISAANLNLNQISPGCVKRPNCLARLNLRRWRLLLCCPDSAAQKRRPRLWIIRKSISPIAVRSWCPSLLLC